jgi:hypothetical protein
MSAVLAVGFTAGVVFLGAVVPTSAAPEPARVTLFSDDFDRADAAPWTARGAAAIATAVDPFTDEQVLKVSGIAHADDGPQLDLAPLGLRPGVQYTIDVAASLAAPDAVPGSGAVHFVVDDGNRTWVSGARSLGTYESLTVIHGAYTPSRSATKMIMYLESTVAPYPDVFIDQVRITGPATPVCEPAAAVVYEAADFDDRALDGLQQVGDPASLTYEKVRGDPSPYALRVSGRVADGDGVRTAPSEFLFFPRSQLSVSARVRLAPGTRGFATMRFVSTYDGSTFGEQTRIGAGEWTTLSGTWDVPPGIDRSQLGFSIGTDDLSTGAASYDYLVDDVTVSTPAVVRPGATPTPTPTRHHGKY